MKIKTLIGVLGMLLPLLKASGQENIGQKIEGRVISATGNEPLPGASLLLKKANKLLSTDANGNFSFSLTGADSLTVRHAGYKDQRVAVNGATTQLLLSLENNSELDNVVVQAYSTTTRRLNTGNISFVTSKDIENQVAINPLGVLQGRIPGLVVTQSNGLPGSNYAVQLRGQNSLQWGKAPLYIIDGIPYIQNVSLASLSATGNSSPFNSINPADIERIDVLKDADATAIYGSQGANGVILITTKKAAPGSMKFTLDGYTGWGRPTRTMPLLNTIQYVSARREAFRNDSIAQTVSNAPDLMVWDTASYTDWKKYFIGGAAPLTNLQASLAAGNSLSSFLLGFNYNSQNTMFPQATPSERINGYLNLSQQSANKRFVSMLSVAYSVYNKKTPNNDMTNYIYLPPNAPALYDSMGKLSWRGWSGVDNPAAQFLNTYIGKTDNLNASLSLQYEVLKGLLLRDNMGYTYMEVNEERSIPIAAQRPGASVRGSMQLQSTAARNWSIEPTLQYNRWLGKGTVRVIGGLSFQQRGTVAKGSAGYDFTDDDLLGNISAAGRFTASNSTTQYKYFAMYGNLNYNWDGKYIINGNIRRDGSSRFGASRRFATFGAMGAAWIFTEEEWLKGQSWLSFGKLRGSYGTTGNDQISDYLYLDSWSAPPTSPYNGQAALLPTKLANPYLEWERTKKLEFGLEAGLFRDRILLTASYFRNRSDNQLIGYVLPSQTGYTGMTANLDALLENKGWEVTAEASLLKGKGWEWKMNGNISIPQSKLLRYPNLATSSDRYTYSIGAPLTSKFGYVYTGVDPKTGIYTYQDIDQDGKISLGNDYALIGNVGQKYYGGMGQSLQFHGWSLNAFLQFVKQTGTSYLANFNTIPGGLGNVATYVLDRWQAAGQVSDIQRFSSGNKAALNTAYQNYRTSSANITDASFIRLKNVSLSYNIPPEALKRAGITGVKIYVQGQNLLTWTKYIGADPENQSILVLPPLRIYTLGAQLSF